MNGKESLRKAIREGLASSPEDSCFLTEPLRLRIDASKTLFAFLSHGFEPDTAPILEYALARGLTVGVPVVRGKDMAFRAIVGHEGPFVTGAFGIREPPPDSPELYPLRDPVWPALILVPGLAFSADGKRLGRGGGYYDRFLSSFLARYANMRREITLAGICNSSMVIDEIPVEPHDIRVDCLLTEKGCILCV